MPSADPRPSEARCSRGCRAAPTILAAVLLLGVAVGEPARSGELPSRGEVSALVETLRAEPDLKTTSRVKVLRLRPPGPKAQQALSPWSIQLMHWTRQAVAWLAETTRWLIWLLGALAVLLAVVSARRWTRERAEARADSPAPLPSHVGALDVRPENLPDRIGAHARMLWQRGEQRAALSLLYRGALARLIHVYRVPIRAAHTESECVRLAQAHLQPDLGGFFARLISVWQLAVYAGRVPEAAGVLWLCDQFDLLPGGSTASKGAD